MKANNVVSSSIMIANLISTILVIAIHYSTKSTIDTAAGYDINYLFQEFFTNGIARSAVPFFALASGIFAATKLANAPSYLTLYKSKAKSLAAPYLIASLLIYTSTAILLIIRNKYINEQGVDILFIIRKIIITPISVQFWFLRDLIILTIISPLVITKNNTIRYSICAIAFYLWVHNTQPFPIIGEWYLINTETLFFFILGSTLSSNQKLVEKQIDCTLKQKIGLLTVWVAIICLRIAIEPELDVWYVNKYSALSLYLYKAGILIGILSILQFSFFATKNRFLIYLSSLTFFAFLFHLKPLSEFKYITGSGPWSFYINLPIATALAFFAAHLTSKYLPVTYQFISGGRNPDKVIQRIS